MPLTDVIVMTMTGAKMKASVNVSTSDTLLYYQRSSYRLDVFLFCFVFVFSFFVCLDISSKYFFLTHFTGEKINNANFSGYSYLLSTLLTTELWTHPSRSGNKIDFLKWGGEFPHWLVCFVGNIVLSVTQLSHSHPFSLKRTECTTKWH